MSAPIGPGDWVECVDVAPRYWNTPEQIRHLNRIRVGALYCVRAIGRVCNYASSPTIMLHGPRAVGEERGMGWTASRFRPIYRPRADLIKRLMQPAPDVEPVA